jgi:hypothetical protein
MENVFGELERTGTNDTADSTDGFWKTQGNRPRCNQLRTICARSRHAETARISDVETFLADFSP